MTRPNTKHLVSLHDSVDVQLLAHALIPSTFATVSSQPGAKLIAPGTPESIDAAFNAIVARLIPDLQAHIDNLVGKDFGPETNEKLSKAITRLLKRLGCYLECPHCRGPATLRYTVYDRHRGPQFKYEHYPRSRHGGTRRIGPLKLIAGVQQMEKFS